MERNYERSSIDEPSFEIFNRLVEALGKTINDKTTSADMKVFVKMVNTVFINFNESFTKKSICLLLLELMEICLDIFRKVGESELPVEARYELLELFWPIYEANMTVGEDSFPKLEESISKMTIPETFQDPEHFKKLQNAKSSSMIRIVDKKYENILKNTFQKIQENYDMAELMSNYLAFDGQFHCKTFLSLI